MGKKRGGVINYHVINISILVTLSIKLTIRRDLKALVELFPHLYQGHTPSAAVSFRLAPVNPDTGI